MTSCAVAGICWSLNFVGPLDFSASASAQSPGGWSPDPFRPMPSRPAANRPAPPRASQTPQQAAPAIQRGAPPRPDQLPPTAAQRPASAAQPGNRPAAAAPSHSPAAAQVSTEASAVVRWRRVSREDFDGDQLQASQPPQRAQQPARAAPQAVIRPATEVAGVNWLPPQASAVRPSARSVQPAQYQVPQPPPSVSGEPFWEGEAGGRGSIDLEGFGESVAPMNLSQPARGMPQPLLEDDDFFEQEPPQFLPEEGAPPPNPFPARNGARAAEPAPARSPQAGAGGMGTNDRASGPISTDRCESMQMRLRQQHIRDIHLDISPTFGIGPQEQADPEQRRSEFAAGSMYRSWLNTSGRVLTDGRLVNVTREHVELETERGVFSVPMADLSDADRVYVARAWDFPEVCNVSNDAPSFRSHVPATVTWTASGLCHKPLYFEQVNLERYGQDRGPLVQPVLSTAHFFTNVAFLPYKMAIHPPSECQYALGYYRPGNCAPWTAGPVPLSIRGAAAQAAVLGVAIPLIP